MDLGYFWLKGSNRWRCLSSSWGNPFGNRDCNENILNRDILGIVQSWLRCLPRVGHSFPCSWFISNCWSNGSIHYSYRPYCTLRYSFASSRCRKNRSQGCFEQKPRLECQTFCPCRATGAQYISGLPNMKTWCFVQESDLFILYRWKSLSLFLDFHSQASPTKYYACTAPQASFP